MKTKLRIVTVIVSALILPACQSLSEPISSNQTGQTSNIPVATINNDSDGDGISDELDICPATPMNVVVDRRGCPFTLIGVGLKMEYRAFFAKDSSELSPEYQLELDKVAARLKEYETATMRIEGHASADEIEAISANDKDLRTYSLARNRALIVKNYLIMQHHIDPNRLSTFSYGDQRPIASSDTEEGRSMNRRVYGVAQEPED